MVRLFADVTSKVPDWTAFCIAIPLLPSRAAKREDYEVLLELRDRQERFLNYLLITKAKYFDNATEYDISAINKVLLRESHKLSFLECRQEMYCSVMAQVQHVAFNEIRLDNEHASKHNPRVKRTRLTFEQAGMLVDKVELQHMFMDGKLIVDISHFRPWNYKEECYMILDVFHNGTPWRTKFCTRFVQIRYFEASWPGAPVAHRIEPLTGSIRGHTKTWRRSDDDDQMQDDADVWKKSQDYKCMLHNLMTYLQDYLLLSDTGNQEHEENSICIWLEDWADDCHTTRKDAA